MKNDSISRRSAIEKFEPWLNVKGYSEGELNMLKAVLYELSNLPSVQPEKRTENARKTHARDLIYRQAAIDAIESAFDRETILNRFVRKIAISAVRTLPSAQPEITLESAIDYLCSIGWMQEHDRIMSASAQQWIPVSELPNDNREVEVTCEVKRLDGKKYRYTCHASYVHRYSIESTGYNNWEECDEYNEEEDMYYALPGWYERVHNWDDYSYCAIEDYVLAWRELPEPFKGER